MLECYPRHVKCYLKEQQCVYSLNSKTKTLMYCRNGQHLSSCRNVTCGGRVKCPNSYCIPHRYICDGKWDCWNGYDEHGCENRTCFGSICIHGDDEIHCDVKFCIDRCKCLSKAIMCQNTALTYKQLQPFLFVNCSFINLLYIEKNWYNMSSQIITLKHNELPTFYPFLSTWVLSSLIKLDVSYNLIVHIARPLGGEIFDNLKELNISNKKLSE